MIPVIDGADRDFGFEAVQITAAKAIAMVGFFERPGEHQAPQEAVFPTSQGGTAKEMKWVRQYDNPPLIGRINRRLGSLAQAAGIVPEADTQFDTKLGKNHCAVENLVYFKGDTHYMVTTVSPDALVKCGVLPGRPALTARERWVAAAQRPGEARRSSKCRRLRRGCSVMLS